MASKKHKMFNFFMISVPWLSTFFIGKHHIKRYSISSILIALYEIRSHVRGRNKKYWTFYDKPKNFIKDELPFDIGPYIPASLWILTFTYGNFKKYVVTNVIFNSLFAFIFIPFLEKIKILRLKRLNHFQFFFYIHYKAYLLYGAQYLVEKVKAVR
ncbi:hypothetical protein ACNRWW_16805 [Metabacillus sp. HB246100]